MPIKYNQRALRDLREFPSSVKERVLVALELADSGGMAQYAKPLKGFHGASVIEIRIPFSSDTYRVVYSIEADAVIFVVHAFKKKSKRGIATPRSELMLIKSRIKAYRG